MRAMHKSSSMASLQTTASAIHKSFSMANLLSRERSPGASERSSARNQRSVAAGMRIADLYFAEELRDSIGAAGVAAWLRETHEHAYARGAGLHKVSSLPYFSVCNLSDLAEKSRQQPSTSLKSFYKAGNLDGETWSISAKGQSPQQQRATHDNEIVTGRNGPVADRCSVGPMLAVR